MCVLYTSAWGMRTIYICMYICVYIYMQTHTHTIYVCPLYTSATAPAPNTPQYAASEAPYAASEAQYAASAASPPQYATSEAPYAASEAAYAASAAECERMPAAHNRCMRTHIFQYEDTYIPV